MSIAPRLPLAALMLAVAPLAAAPLSAAESDLKKQDAETLDRVEVVGSRIHKSYLPNTRIAKVLQDPHELPQAITSVPKILMQQQQVGSLREALRNVSGLTFNAAEGGRSGDNMMLRGFYTFGDIYLDGMRDTAQYNRETFNLEQVDVLRGAAAMLFGRGQAGGVINQVSKSPLRESIQETEASNGSQGYRQAKADANFLTGDSSGLRINLMHRDELSERENPATGLGPELHRDGIAVAYAFGMGERHEVQLAHSSTQTRDVPDYGVAFDRSTRRVNTNFDANAFWGTPATFDDSDTDLTSVLHTFRIDQETSLRTQLRSANYERQYWAKTPSATLAPSAVGATGGNQTRNSDYETISLQSDFNTHFAIAERGNDVLIGVEYLKEAGFRRALLNIGSVSEPRYLPHILNPAATASRFDGDSKALYAQNTLEFAPHWHLLLGARYDRLDANYLSVTSPALRFGETSTRAGLSFQPNDYAHYYLSSSDSFSPTADLYQISGAAYPAERSDVLELGTKFLLMGGDLALRAAAYRATKNWERNTDLESSAAILTRKRRTDGLELDLVGKLSDDWEVFSGFALMDATVLQVAENRNATTGALTRADARLIGQKARNTPDYTINLWTTYRFAPGWKIGLGLENKGKRLVYSPSSADVSALFVNGQFDPNTAPAFIRWDAMLAFESKHWEARVNFRNLFDEIYYDALYDNGGFAVPGMRRGAVMSVEYKF
jgi:catecholate siderophore receptor